jgi:transcription initiation factor IIE alpha subunit
MVEKGYNRPIMAIDQNQMLSLLAREIKAATERLEDGECLEDDLPTSADLARQLNYRLDAVKKKLKMLKESGLIQPTSMTPKRYRFNAWAYKSLDDDDPLRELFMESVESIDWDD